MLTPWTELWSIKPIAIVPAITQSYPGGAIRSFPQGDAAYKKMIKAILAELGNGIITNFLMEPGSLEIYTTDKAKNHKIVGRKQDHSAC
ncbi:MAG TPA: hypothetical protein VLR89_07935 [Anaerolineaceae bacterium]|nr:hypothetical protein [Anaerolineaceae bacterium]